MPSPFQGRQRREAYARLMGTCLIELDVLHPHNFVFTRTKTTKNIERIIKQGMRERERKGRVDHEMLDLQRWYLKLKTVNWEI